MRTIGIISGFSIAGSILGFLYGGIFAYVMIRMLSDSQPTLNHVLVNGWFAVFGWGAGMVVAALMGVVTVIDERRRQIPP